MKTNEKRGISLIVLVITIIVMIILATAIILTLSNTGIIGKANKAKTDSDNANLKEYVNTLRAEYELMTEDEKNGQTFEAYANERLEAKGYNRMLSEDGVLLTESATAAVKAGIKVGDIVKYNVFLSDKSYTTDGSENTCNISNNVETNPQPQLVKSNTSNTWKYIGIGEDGSIIIAPEISRTMDPNYNIILSGKGGYLNGTKILNTVCDALYTTEKGTATSMNIETVEKILKYNGAKGSYYDISGNEVQTLVPLTIEEVCAKLGSTLSEKLTPDGKDINTYLSNSYNISKTSDKITTDETKKALVYQKKQYWLASSCVSVFRNK